MKHLSEIGIKFMPNNRDFERGLQLLYLDQIDYFCFVISYYF